MTEEDFLLREPKQPQVQNPNTALNLTTKPTSSYLKPSLQGEEEKQHGKAIGKSGLIEKIAIKGSVQKQGQEMKEKVFLKEMEYPNSMDSSPLTLSKDENNKGESNEMENQDYYPSFHLPDQSRNTGKKQPFVASKYHLKVQTTTMKTMKDVISTISPFSSGEEEKFRSEKRQTGERDKTPALSIERLEKVDPSKNAVFSRNPSLNKIVSSFLIMLYVR